MLNRRRAALTRGAFYIGRDSSQQGNYASTVIIKTKQRTILIPYHHCLKRLLFRHPALFSSSGIEYPYCMSFRYDSKIEKYLLAICAGAGIAVTIRRAIEDLEKELV